MLHSKEVGMPVSESIRPDNYRFLQQHVYLRSGIVLDQDKQYLFECRLAPIVNRLGLPSIDQLCDVLRVGDREDVGRQVVDAMTTNETYFFRDPAQYNVIRDRLAEQLRCGFAEGTRARFWSAAASTGQEAYSLAMLLMERGFGRNDVEIIGTDLSTSVLQRARTSRYQQIEVNRGLPASLLVKYFSRVGVEWELKDCVRNLVSFLEFDLRTSADSLGVFNLVFCRNVLIYFDTATRRQILENIRSTLRTGGWLLIGGAETFPGVETWFERKVIDGAVVYVAR